MVLEDGGGWSAGLVGACGLQWEWAGHLLEGEPVRVIGEGEDGARGSQGIGGGCHVDVGEGNETLGHCSLEVRRIEPTVHIDVKGEDDLPGDGEGEG